MFMFFSCLTVLAYKRKRAWSQIAFAVVKSSQMPLIKNSTVDSKSQRQMAKTITQWKEVSFWEHHEERNSKNDPHLQILCPPLWPHTYSKFQGFIYVISVFYTCYSLTTQLHAITLLCILWCVLKLIIQRFTSFLLCSCCVSGWRGLMKFRLSASPGGADWTLQSDSITLESSASRTNSMWTGYHFDKRFNKKTRSDARVNQINKLRFYLKMTAVQLWCFLKVPSLKVSCNLILLVLEQS